MSLSDADYAEIKQRFAKDTLSVRVLHVIGDLDANSLRTRRPLQIGNGSHLWSGLGVPSANLGNNRDYYFREDPSGATHLYFKASGAWSAVV